MMALLLSALLLFLWGGPARCLQEDGEFSFQTDLRHIAVDHDMVYIATEEILYQLDHKLTLIRTLTQRGILTEGSGENHVQFKRLSSEMDQWSATLHVNVLLPFDAGPQKSLISCGVTDDGCGHCELLDLRNISNVLYNETIEVGSLRRSSSSVSFLVNVDTGRKTETYILAAVQQYRVKSTETSRCPPASGAVSLHNTNNDQEGMIFSRRGHIGEPVIKHEGDVEFVDGFQRNSIIYLFSNLPSDDRSNRVRLLWLQGKTGKVQTLRSLWGATLSAGGRSSRLVAASVVPGGPSEVPGGPSVVSGEPLVLWSGVFSVDGGATNTELLLFDISPDLSGPADNDPDFCGDCPRSRPLPKTLKPKKVIFRQSSMTSVLAVRQKTWTVFYIGTGDGQLIKLSMDKNFHTTCPRVLYRANDDRKVFPQLHLDQVDQKHVYVPFQNQINRVSVSKCSSYRSAQDCWSAQDPHCVWCGSKERCSFEDDCEDSDWISIPDDFQQKIISYKVSQDDSGQTTLKVQVHVSAGPEALSNFACQFSATSSRHFKMESPRPQFPQCTAVLTNSTLPAEGLHVVVKMRLGKTNLSENLKLFTCTNISGPPTSGLCRQCIKAGCSWTPSGCSWANQDDSVCQKMESWKNFSRPEISSISPSVVSFHGRNQASLSGRNLRAVTGVRIQADMDCTPQDLPVWNRTHENLMFNIPTAENKGVVKVCVLLPDGSCHGEANITYRSAPSCSLISPTSTWFSGRRIITVSGSLLEFAEALTHTSQQVFQTVTLPRKRSNQALTFDSPPAENQGTFSSRFSLRVANVTLDCSVLTYYPDPEFISFSSTRTGDDVRITIQKKADRLNMTEAELIVWGIHNQTPHPCIMQLKEISEDTEFFICEIQNKGSITFRELKLQYGDKTVTLKSTFHLYFLTLLVLLLIPCIIVAVMIIYRRKQKTLTEKMNKTMENLELDIRNDIRQGFVDLQTEKAELMENVGAIPFLDYKHFASRIFFPESETLMKSCIRDIGQDVVKVQLDEPCKGLSHLIQDQMFITCMVHALEEQKSFTIKDKCALASLLTVALHNNLAYLTEVMEALLRALMQQNSNTQPKLLLRRTESTVEKLLTNWMSICLYGFLRESVGQHLFLMVSALIQQSAKGPVDCVTEKALYTLSEDWLLWQAQDFSSLKLKVLFAVGTDGEVSEPLEVTALTCDSVEQVKQKILSTFKAKFGFPYNTGLRDIHIQYEKNGSFVPLEEVDSSSEVIGEVTMLNTLKHYQVPDGATIKVLSTKTHPPLSPQGSVKDDENFSGKYFHLIDPDVDEDQRKSPERKKLKLKEVHLTKLLSTKVAVHSYVENLFRSIWAMQHSRAPHAVKYFFDFLDAQADNMKITDPDVLHIWKTNSLPLRFWINILKNPQFVFDMEKTPNLDGCLSVIAQAFMDSFSLSETQLGKHAPTNKLLYAKDIPKFKQEVKVYYKQVKDQPPVSASEFKVFLQEESKKHENEFNEAAALREIYKFIQRYHTEIKEKLDQNGAPAELMERLHHVKKLFDGLKSCSWN